MARVLTHLHKQALVHLAQFNIAMDMTYDPRGKSAAGVFDDLQHENLVFLMYEDVAVITGRGAQMLKGWIDRNEMHGLQLDFLTPDHLETWAQKWPDHKAKLEARKGKS